MTFRTEQGEKTIHFDFLPTKANNGSAQRETFKIDERNSVGIFTIPSCWYNERYCSLLNSFFERVFASGIENVVVDLRGNTGGNSMVANEFITYLDVDEYRSWDVAIRYGNHLEQRKNNICINEKKEKVFDGNLYVLTDLQTYSAGMDFAMLIADNHLGTLIGEPSGNLPDSYGDILQFQLPHSRLGLIVSYKKWYRVDLQKSGEPIMPDVLCPSEEAMDKAYEIIQAQ